MLLFVVGLFLTAPLCGVAPDLGWLLAAHVLHGVGAALLTPTSLAIVEAHWGALVRLSASVMSVHASAVAALARFGPAARGDPIYEAWLGRLLCTAFLADWFVNTAFRREMRRVLNPRTVTHGQQFRRRAARRGQRHLGRGRRGGGRTAGVQAT